MDTVATNKKRAESRKKNLKKKGYNARVVKSKKPKRGFKVNIREGEKVARFAIYKKRKR